MLEPSFSTGGNVIDLHFENVRGQAAARAQYALCPIFLERSFFSGQTALGRRLTSLSGSIATLEMYDGFVNAKRNWLINQYGMPSRDHGGDVEDELETTDVNDDSPGSFQTD